MQLLIEWNILLDTIACSGKLQLAEGLVQKRPEIAL